ncbi:MAG: hypothetical protein Kow0092_23560 [Deferrisomatales bacterium]
MKPFAVVAVLIGLLAPPGAWGEEPVGALLLGLYTRHVDPSAHTNEENELVAVGYRDYTAARFVNSYNDPSYFAGKRFHTRRFGSGDLFVQGNLYAGALYGYHKRVPNLGGLTLGVLPTLGVGYRNAAVELLYVPTPRGGVFTSFLSFRWYGNKGRSPVAEPGPGGTALAAAEGVGGPVGAGGAPGGSTGAGLDPVDR